jgi:hypothetical protein
VKSKAYTAELFFRLSLQVLSQATSAGLIAYASTSAGLIANASTSAGLTANASISAGLIANAATSVSPYLESISDWLPVNRICSEIELL